MDASFAKDVADGCTLSVRLHPGARKNGVTGIQNRRSKDRADRPASGWKSKRSADRFSC